MQVTVTVQVPDKHRTRVRLLRMQVRPGAVALGKAHSRALPATQEMPVIASPLDDPNFMGGVMALLYTPDPTPGPKPRKASCDIDAKLLVELCDFRETAQRNADQEQQFAQDRADERSTENKLRQRHGKELIPADPEMEQESAGKIAGYLLVADAMQEVITACKRGFDDYLACLPAQVEYLESNMTNQNDPFSSMRDKIIAAEVSEITRRWMGE